VAPDVLRITRQKRIALADCNGLLNHARDELDALITRGSGEGLDVDEVEDLAPLALRVMQLRERRVRLQDELRAITAEWAV
jgi:hypothetical protein